MCLFVLVIAVVVFLLLLLCVYCQIEYKIRIFPLAVLKYVDAVLVNLKKAIWLHIMGSIYQL